MNQSADKSLVVVIDDDPSIRRALENLLRSVNLEARTFESAEEFEQANLPDVPTCLVLDVRMPGMSGLDFHRKIAEGKRHFPVIFITGHGDIPMAVQAMKAGAAEFLTKPFREADLLEAIYTGIEKDRVCRSEEVGLADLQARWGALTAREREIMSHVAVGRLNKQVAADLGLSEITIKVSRAQIMRKMRVTSFADLVRIADRLGVTTTKDR